MFRLLGFFLIFGWVSGQDLKAPPRCTGPECAERVRVEEQRRPRRVQKRAETRVDRYGRPRPTRRAERFRPFVYTPRHKPMERWEAFRPYEPSVRHLERAERFRLPLQSRRSRASMRAERYRIPGAKLRHSPRASERMRLAQRDIPHANRAERFSFPFLRRRHRPAIAERRRIPSPALSHSQRAERLRTRFSPTPHTQRAEKHTLRPSTPSHRREERNFFIPLPAIPHRPERAERHLYRARIIPHRSVPQRFLYTVRPPRHKRSSEGGCTPPSVSHRTYAEGITCIPFDLQRRNFDKYACEVSSIRHRQWAEKIACHPSRISHKQFDKYACRMPVVQHYRRRTERVSCGLPQVAHKNFDRYTCASPSIRHLPPSAYEVPCDAQRRGVMTATERLAHDLRYLFTHHRKHCELVSAYSGFSVGEWVNTQAYGRVPVAGVKMGWRVYVFAHFYDRQGRLLKKPRLEKRKVWAVKQIEVWVLEPARGSSTRRRYIKGLPGIEGFGEMGGLQLVKKRLTIEETKAIQIEKLVRKRQIAWLVRAYPEERVRLEEWLKKYAGPKPTRLWPGIDYRLLEIW
ncbi:MAG: hypothetical protein N2170_01560 [Bacteroidia bacterium]|nr:hypothetical protein [Bacteroidia bacterium]